MKKTAKKKTAKKKTAKKKTAKKTLVTEQVGGTHYSRMAIEPWDYVAANDLGYFEGSVIKYVSRWEHKGGVEDLLKARHFLDKLIEVSRHVSDR